MPRNLSIDPYFDEHNDEPPRSDSNRAMGNESGSIGVANPSPAFAPEHNPSKSILGGDNRTDLGPMAVYGNPEPGAVMGSGDSIAELGLQDVENNPGRDQVARWFRGGSSIGDYGVKGRTVH